MPKLVAFQAHSDGVLFLFCFPFYNLFLVFSRARAHGMGVIRYELSPFPKKAGGSFNFPPHISVSSWGGVKLDTNACTNKKVLRYQHLRPKKKLAIKSNQVNFHLSSDHYLSSRPPPLLAVASRAPCSAIPVHPRRSRSTLISTGPASRACRLAGGWVAVVGLRVAVRRHRERHRIVWRHILGSLSHDLSGLSRRVHFLLRLLVERSTRLVWSVLEGLDHRLS
jgi:hypothetical protein